jgi:hypothetical protein
VNRYASAVKSRGGPGEVARSLGLSVSGQRGQIVFDLSSGTSYDGLKETEASHGYDPTQAGA